MSENTAIQARTISAVTLEIRTLHAQAQQLMLGYAIEIGRRLVEAKGLLPHGAWGEYLKNEVNYSQSTAQNFMKIFDEYGADQQSLLGPVAKSQTLGNLPYTKALALLAIPSDEREEFIESNDVEGMSTRELKEAIRARDEALMAKESAEAERRLAEQSRDKLSQEMIIANAAMESHRETEAHLDEVVAGLRKELEELRSQPIDADYSEEPDAAALDAARQEGAESAAQAARKEAEERLKAKIEKAEKAKEKAEQAKIKAEQDLNAMKVAQEEAAAITEREKQAMAEQVQTLQKKLAVASSSEMTIFKLHFEQGQASVNKMVECIRKMTDGGDTEGAEKLKKALAALLTATMEMLK